MKTHELFGTVRTAGEPCNRDRRGVGSQNRMWLKVWQQAVEDCLLHDLFFGRSFNNQIGLAKHWKLLCGFNSCKCSGFIICADLLAADLAFHVLINARHRCGQRILIHVIKHDIVASQRHNMGNTVAHLARADNPDFLNVHVSPFAALPHHRTLFAMRARCEHVFLIS